jgi:hypothetical protein
MVSLRLTDFRRVVLTCTLATMLVWVLTDRNDFLLALNLYPSNDSTIESWAFLGRDWIHSYVINSYSFGYFSRFGLAFMQQQL